MTIFSFCKNFQILLRTSLTIVHFLLVLELLLVVSFIHDVVQKISPDTKEKVQLQLVMHNGEANTFHFRNTAGRDSQVADREKVKEHLQRLLPQFRSKINSELERKHKCVYYLFHRFLRASQLSIDCFFGYIIYMCWTTESVKFCLRVVFPISTMFNNFTKSFSLIDNGSIVELYLNHSFVKSNHISSL